MLVKGLYENGIPPTPSGYNFDHCRMRELSEAIVDMEINKKALCTSDQKEKSKL